MATLLTVTVCALLTLGHSQDTSHKVNVTISLGTVTGLHFITPIEYYSFRGIPYANVTTRFKAPIPMKCWKTIVMATEDGPACAQPAFRGSSESLVEDCLFINVYTPQLPKQSDIHQNKLPVMVFIHGGGFIGGSSSSQTYGPEFFMNEKNVVLVTFNYRLGIFGFLSTGTSDAQGNAGMKDQVEALRWINREISYFGGDPTSITIFGESSGAASVVHHVLSPMSKGLFHRAIAESGSALADWAYLDSKAASEYASIVAADLNCDTTNTTVGSCLREAPVPSLLAASLNISLQVLLKSITLVFAPAIEMPFKEETFLPTSPLTAIKNVRAPVPLLIGTNNDEGMFVLSDDDNIYTYADNNLQIFAPRSLTQCATAEQLDRFVQLIREKYFNGGNVSRTMLKGYVDVISDRAFVYPTAQTVRKLVKKKSAVHLYNFAYIGNYTAPHTVADKLGYEGVAHSDELGYLFYSSVFNNDAGLNKTSTQDFITMQRMVKLWIAFATTGAPSDSNDEVIEGIHWPQVTTVSDFDYLEMNTSFTATNGYYEKRIALWDELSHLCEVK